MRKVKIVALVLCIIIFAVSLSGCWDARELEKLFILTGVGIDVSESDPEMYDYTFQISNIISQKKDEGQKDNSVITFEFVAKTTSDAVAKMHKNNDQSLMIQHNQIRLFGEELARQGLFKHIDMMVRDYQTRLEVPMAIVEGRARDVLALKLPHESNTGIFLNGMFKQIQMRSEKFEVRLIDFVNMLLDDCHAPIIPLIRIIDTENGEKGFELAGMAVFKEDKMVGKLNTKETLGYAVTFGNISNLELLLEDGEDVASVRFAKNKCKRKVKIDDNDKVTTSLDIAAEFSLIEMQGFKGLKEKEILEKISQMVEKEIKKIILATYEKSKEYQVDIFKFCGSVEKFNSKKWEEVKDKWIDMIMDMKLDIKVKATIKRTGHIINSVESEATDKK